tara:strand:- start:611 stop:1195 length:585 start_codon:yes stop_codon:yes gene_type:complete
MKEKPTIVSNVRAYQIDPKKHTIKKLEDLEKLKPVAEVKNLDMFGAYDVIGRAMAGYSAYYINTYYFEFANGAAPATPVFDRDDTIAYYLGLGANRDFLRIPIAIAPSLSASTTDYDSNRATFFAVSSGHTAGFNGTTFSNASASRVIGIALVCSPDLSDQTQDIVCARAYFSTSIPLLANENIGITHAMTFLP